MKPSLEQGLWRRRRVRLVRQTEIAECGLACLAMIAAYRGASTELGVLRQRFPTSARGMGLRSLILTADKMGLNARAVKVPLQQLHALAMPAILHWDLNHFVVIERVGKAGALIHNPDGVSAWTSLDTVSQHFTGIAVELQPTADFRPGKERSRLKLTQLWSRLDGLKRALAQTLVLSLLLQLFVLLSPYYMQVAIDSVLPALDADLLLVLALGFGLFALINAAATCLRGFVLLNAGSALGFGLASNIARHLFCLPLEWFERRHLGDVLSRFQSVTPIQTLLVEGAVAAVVDGVLATVTLAMMVFYSPPLAALAAAAFVLYALVRIATFPAQRAAQEAAIVTRGIEQTNLIESMRGIAALRLTNRETMRYSWWQSRLADSINAGVHVGRITVWQLTAGTLLFTFEMVLSTYIAVKAVIAGGFSLGMLFAYMAYKVQFLDKARSLIDQVAAFRMLRLHLERLSDIVLSPEDVSYASPPSRQEPLKGAIELRHVSYRYSPTDPWVLRDVSLSIAAGEHVAITGPSGGGKSTLAKILLGLVEPTDGQVLIDGVPLEQFGHQNYHDQIGAVLQEDALFLGSIADNISLFDDAPRRELIESSARTAAIHAEILSWPMRYETFVGNMGSALSGGQKQRILLARALYRSPRLLVMDEGTAHLDADHERRINAAVRELGMTRIVVAHRKETIAAADRVLLLQGGRIRTGTETASASADAV